MLLDEMMQKGWGIGSGISLFILAGVAQGIMWDSFGITATMADGKTYGAFIALGQTILGGQPLANAFFRYDSELALLQLFQLC